MAQSTSTRSDSHSTSMTRGAWSVSRLSHTALLAALSLVLTFVEFPIFPVVPWLMYDPSGVVGLVAGLVFGPVTGALVVVLPWVAKTLFSPNVYGHLMAIIANLTLVVPAALIARKLPNKGGLVLGLITGSVLSVVACLISNLIITPLYTPVPVDQVIAWIVPALLPFNALKVLANSVVGALVYPPVRRALDA